VEFDKVVSSIPYFGVFKCFPQLHIFPSPGRVEEEEISRY